VANSDPTINSHRISAIFEKSQIGQFEKLPYLDSLLVPGEPGFEN